MKCFCVSVKRQNRHLSRLLTKLLSLGVKSSLFTSYALSHQHLHGQFTDEPAAARGRKLVTTSADTGRTRNLATITLNKASALLTAAPPAARGTLKHYLMFCILLQQDSWTLSSSLDACFQQLNPNYDWVCSLMLRLGKLLLFIIWKEGWIGSIGWFQVDFQHPPFSTRSLWMKRLLTWSWRRSTGAFEQANAFVWLLDICGMQRGNFTVTTMQCGFTTWGRFIRWEDVQGHKQERVVSASFFLLLLDIFILSGHIEAIRLNKGGKTTVVTLWRHSIVCYTKKVLTGWYLQCFF